MESGTVFLWWWRGRLVRLAVVILLPQAFAQTTSASIAGSVIDTHHAAITNTTVTISDHARKLILVTRTDGEGRFVSPHLPPGVYDIAVESSGFKKLEQVDVHTRSPMTIGAVSETVEVQAQAAQLKTASAERSAAIVGKQLDNLAVNGRSYLQLAGLAPGIVSTNNLSTGGVGGLGSISANGARREQNNLTLDGVGNVDTGSNGSQLTSLSLDSMQDFKILTSDYQAEYGRSSGAQISVVIKSGTDEFHGGGYDYHRNESLNANNWKNNRDGRARNLFRFIDPGYAIGGPVYIPKLFNRNKDNLFFFFSQEYQRQLKPPGRRDATFPTGPHSHRPFVCAGNGHAQLLFPKPNAQGSKGFNFTSQISDSYPRRQSFVLRGGAAIFYDWFQGNEVFDRLADPPTTFAPTPVNGFSKMWIDPKNILIEPSGLNALDYNGEVPTVH